MKQRKVLVFEKDPVYQQVLSDWLTSEGIHSVCTSNAGCAISALLEQRFDFAILSEDHQDGEIAVLKHLRCRLHSSIPVLFILTSNSQDAIVNALQAGADDFLKQPFLKRDFLDRVSRMISSQAEDHSLRNCYPYQFDLIRQDISLFGRSLLLSPDEYSLSSYLFFFRNRIVFSAELARELWGEYSPVICSSADQQVMRLRKRLRFTEVSTWDLQVLPGIGYRLIGESDNKAASQFEVAVAG